MAGIWTTDALDTVLYTRVTAALSKLEDAEKREQSSPSNSTIERQTATAFKRGQSLLKELFSLAIELGCENAAELASEGYSTYFGTQL